MKKSQLENMIVKPTLNEIPKGFAEPAGLAVMMIIAHESKRGEYIHQLGNGPALGMIQMEPNTHDSVWTYGASVWDNALKLGIITKEQMRHSEHPPAERLLYDLRYNVFMARQRLFMKIPPLPDLEGLPQLNAMSDYLKQHWNSVLGAATDHSYSDDYMKWS